MDAIVVFITAASRSEAEKIAEKLVETHLAACVNILPAIKSVFRWEGKVNQEEEILLIAKSEKACFEKLQKRVQEIHGYEVPEIIALPIIAGLPEYLNWITAETQSKSPC